MTGREQMISNFKEGRIRLGIRKEVFTIRVVRNRQRLPRKLVGAQPWIHLTSGWTRL